MFVRVGEVFRAIAAHPHGCKAITGGQNFGKSADIHLRSNESLSTGNPTPFLLSLATAVVIIILFRRATRIVFSTTALEKGGKEDEFRLPCAMITKGSDDG